jgi:hypothetical protein
VLAFFWVSWIAAGQVIGLQDFIFHADARPFWVGVSHRGSPNNIEFLRNTLVFQEYLFL